jgi:hypothetical protein
MKLSLILAFLWVVASALTAMLPMKRQIFTGLPLLIAAPFILGYLGYQYNIWVVLAGLAAFVSMFRHPLKYFVRRALGLPVQIPKEFERPKA